MDLMVWKWQNSTIKKVMSEKNQGLQCREGGRWKYQAFIQAIWMSGRWHKKLSLLFEFSYSILIKFNYVFFYFKLFIWPPFVKNNNFLGFYTWHPHQGSAMNLLQSLQHLENPTSILYNLKILLENEHQ